LPLLLNKMKLHQLADVGRIDEVEGLTDRLKKLAGIKIKNIPVKQPEPPKINMNKKHKTEPPTRPSAPEKPITNRLGAAMEDKKIK